jgi:hypothetical protein
VSTKVEMESYIGRPKIWYIYSSVGVYRVTLIKSGVTLLLTLGRIHRLVRILVRIVYKYIRTLRLLYSSS